MSSNRVKAIVIAMLAILNLYFLVLMAAGAYIRSEDIKAAGSAVSKAYSSAGITIEAKLPLNETPVKYNISRDLRRETVFAEAAIGAAALTRDGAGGDIYENDKGTVRISTLGEFIVEYKQPDSIYTNDVDNSERKYAEKTAKNLNLDFTDIETAGEGGFTQVYGNSVYKGKRVLGSPISFEFQDGLLMRISGFLIGYTAKDPEAVRFYELPTLMISLLGMYTHSDITLGTISFGIISEVSPAFYRTQSTKNNAPSPDLSFGYIVKAQEGTWFLNAETGEIKRI